ncbi:MAG: HAMP domain-containing histidine kinase [Calothrix sp. C42_A2020_038]|nr:HAMP domain-containing histidine kinase [Calothrix sp. C42_A2020_038]
MSNSITADLFAVLNILVLERLKAGSFRIAGLVPAWLQRFCRSNLEPGAIILIPEQEFPFLEHFLVDAEQFWLQTNTIQLKSGMWIESDLTGKEGYFEASAICLEDQKILLIELQCEDYQEKQSIIQKARENQLNYYQLVKENQKKEILIHCIIHDIAGQLSGINCCLALLELENLTAKGKERLEIGRRQSMKQEMLIREVLDAFSADVQSLESFNVDIANAPNVLSVIQEVIEFLTPTFALNKIKIKLGNGIDRTANWKVVGERSRLERVISNLSENAFRHSPSESTIAINLSQDREFIFVAVDDQGSGVRPNEVASLFQKFSQGKNKPGRIGLGLYFCRITIERWGGEIGYSPHPEGGSRFWFRLPKPKE